MGPLDIAIGDIPIAHSHGFYLIEKRRKRQRFALCPTRRFLLCEELPATQAVGPFRHWRELFDSLGRGTQIRTWYPRIHRPEPHEHSADGLLSRSASR